MDVLGEILRASREETRMRRNGCAMRPRRSRWVRETAVVCNLQFRGEEAVGSGSHYAADDARSDAEVIPAGGEAHHLPRENSAAESARICDGASDGAGRRL